MNKINYLRFIASFMITLIITIPIYSASVFAGLNNTKAKGSDGIDGYIRVDDYVTFETTASISGDIITQNQVWLGAKDSFFKRNPAQTPYFSPGPVEKRNFSQPQLVFCGNIFPF